MNQSQLYVRGAECPRSGRPVAQNNPRGYPAKVGTGPSLS